MYKDEANVVYRDSDVTVVRDSPIHSWVTAFFEMIGKSRSDNMMVQFPFSSHPYHLPHIYACTGIGGGVFLWNGVESHAFMNRIKGPHLISSDTVSLTDSRILSPHCYAQYDWFKFYVVELIRDIYPRMQYTSLAAPVRPLPLDCTSIQMGDSPPIKFPDPLLCKKMDQLIRPIESSFGPVSDVIDAFLGAVDLIPNLAYSHSAHFLKTPIAAKGLPAIEDVVDDSVFSQRTKRKARCVSLLSITHT
jgi:hypothetical protein